jgi:hypothetical protein
LVVAVADGSTSIIMRLDIMEGKERQAAKEFANLNLEGTVITLRLMKPCIASGRTVHADSAFSSVYTLSERRVCGLHFMGLMKTALKELLMAYLKMKAINYGRGAAKPRGGHILLKSEVSPAGTRHEPILALGRYDAKAKFIVSSCGSTVAGKPCVRPRTRVEVQNGDLVTVAYLKLVLRLKCFIYLYVQSKAMIE